MPSENSSGDIIIIDGDTLALMPIQAVRMALFREDNLRAQISVHKKITQEQTWMISTQSAIIGEQRKTILDYVTTIGLFRKKEDIYEAEIKRLETQLRNTRVIVYIVSGVAFVALIL
ncbi:MAG: hypothetical protein ACOCVN_03475 [bacterium]